MKKLMVFSVILALLAGSVFAVDLGGEVIGTYTVVSGNNVEKDDPTSGGSMDRLRLQGDGENEDGTFGAWMRVEPTGFGYDEAAAEKAYQNGLLKWMAEDPVNNTDPGDFDFDEFNPDYFLFSGFQGYVWWKPIDQFLMRIGGNSDGIWGKEGYTGWMFYQRVADTGVVSNSNTWGGDYAMWPARFRAAFYSGYGDNRLAFEIKPVEMFGINIGLPFDGWDSTDEDGIKHWNLTKDLFLHVNAQIDVNLDFGNIALTVDLNGKDGDDKIQGNMYLYAGISAIDNVDLDIGLGIDFAKNSPIAAGVGAKVGITDEFGLKARLLGVFGGKDYVAAVDKEFGKPFMLAVEVQPYYAISDNLKAFFAAGLNMSMVTDSDVKKANDDAKISNSTVGWHINPYLWVGEEWGPSFWAGIRIWGDGSEWKPDNKLVKWEVPIAIGVSF